MDELFGETRFAQADNELKEKIERDIGLTALLNNEDTSAVKSSPDTKADSGDNNAELVEKTSS